MGSASKKDLNNGEGMRNSVASNIVFVDELQDICFCETSPSTATYLFLAYINIVKRHWTFGFWRYINVFLLLLLLIQQCIFC